MTGFNVGKSSNITINDINAIYCYFEDGMIYIDTENKNDHYLGFFKINGGYFSGIMGGNSTIVNVKSIDERVSVEINEATFEGCISMDYGSGICNSFSNNKEINKYIRFNDCMFYNISSFESNKNNII